MTRLKKLLVAGLLTIVTCCAALGSALLNITQSIFTKHKVSANTDYAYSNKNTTSQIKQGKIIVVDSLVTSGKTDGTPISIPTTVKVMDIAGSTLTEVTAVVEIKNPYGDFLVNSKGEVSDGQVTKVFDNKGTPDDTADDVLTGYTLTPSQVGIYTVQYAYQDPNTSTWTVSDIYQINVTAESYSTDFVVNDPIVMPSKVDTTVNKPVAVSLPIFYNEDGEQIKKFVVGNYGDDAYVAEYVTENDVWLDEDNAPVKYEDNASGAQGKNIYETYSTYKITKKSLTDVKDDASIEHGLYIEVAIPGNKTVTNSIVAEPDNGPSLKFDETKFSATGEAYYVSAPYTFDAENGKNILTYRLCDKLLKNYQTPYAYVNRTVNGSDSYDSENIKLGASVTANVKESSTSINEKCYLPKVSTVDLNENKNALNAYFYYEVKYVVDDKNSSETYDTSSDKVVMGIDDKGAYFIPKVRGLYNISYNAVDFYGNKDSDYTKYDYDVNVTDRTSPTIKIVNNYDPAKINDYDFSVDYSYVIPTKYTFNADKTAQAKDWTVIEIPALYAEDNVKSFGELSLKRTISSENGFINSKGESVKNYYLNVQSTTGNTDFNADNDAKDIEVSNIITFFNPNKTDYKTISVDDGQGGTITKRVIEYADFTIEEQQDGTCLFKDKNGALLTGSALTTAKASQVAYVVLNPNLFSAGTYTVEYYVFDENHSNDTGPTFSFELVADDAENPLDAKAPTVDFGSVSLGNVTKDQKITIAKPEVKDDVDDNILVNYYALIEDVTVESKKQDVYVPLKLEDNKLSFRMSDTVKTANNKTIYELASSSEEGSFKVVAFAYDDFATIFYPEDEENFDFSKFVEDNTGYENVGVGYYTITLKEANDEVAPYIKERLTNAEIDETAPYDQFKEVSVNGIKYYDNTPNAKLAIKVFDSNGVEYSYQGLGGYTITKLDSPVSFNGADYNYEYSFKGIKFTANKADSYTINYSVTDDGNNSSSYSFVLTTATDREAPTIEGVLGTTITKELGDTFYLDTLKTTDNTEGKITYEVQCVGSSESVGDVSHLFNPYKMEFTPDKADTYTITVKAIDEDDNFSTRSLIVKFADTTAPELSLNGGNTDDMPYNEGYDEENENVDWAEEKFPEVKLPGFSVTDFYKSEDPNAGSTIIPGATGSITITTPSNDSYVIDITGNIEGNNPLKIERRKVGLNDMFFFTPTERGQYTVKYTGEDASHNSATAKTIRVLVGDTVDPVVTLKDSFAKLLKNGFVIGSNDELHIDVKAIIDATTLRTGESDDIKVSDDFGFKKDQLDTDKNVFATIKVEVLDENGSIVNQESNTNGVVSYKFTTQGTYTINFTVSDGVSNTGTLSKNFKVTAKTSSSTDTTKILGTVLIVVSIVVLAGVVIYFVKGTKMLPKKNKAKKQKAEKDNKND